MQVKDYKVDIDSIFSEGIPYKGGYVIDGDDCSTKNKTKFKKHSVDYLKRIEEKIAKLESNIDVENTKTNDAFIEGANIGAEVGGAVVAGGAAAATAAADGAISEQILSFGGNLMRGVGQGAKNAAKEGFGAWEDGVGKIGKEVKGGAREGINAWKEGTQELGRDIKNGAREGTNAWKEGASKLSQRARSGYERYHPPAVQPIQVY